MLVTLDNQIDNTTGTSKLKAVFDNKDNALFPQQFVNIRLLVDTLTNQLVVPNVAVQNGQQGTFVYVVDDDSKSAPEDRFRWESPPPTSADILSGISDGDRVVVDGTDRLIEGAVVRVRKAGELDNPPGYDAGGGGRRAAVADKKGDGKGKKGDGGSRRARAEALAGESLPNLHPEAGGDVADDGRRGARRCHGVPATAGLGAAPGRLPDHADPDVLPGREPGGSDVFDHRAAREAVRPGARTDADDVDQFFQQFADHAAVFARSQHRRRRAGGAGRHQCSHDFSSQQSPGSSHLQQDESRRRADSDAGHYVFDGAAAESRRAGRNAHGAENFPAQGRGPGEHQRRAASGRPGAGESHRAGILWTESGGSANGAGQRQREPGQRQFRRTGSGLDDQRQRPASGRRSVRADHHCLPQWGARAHSRCRHRHRRRGKHQARRLGERRPGHRSEYSAAARDQHHQRRRYGSGAPSANRSVSAGGDPRAGHHRPHHHHPGIGEGRRIRTDAHHRAGGDGHLSVPAQRFGHHHPGHRRASFAGGHLRRHVPAGVQPGQPLADGAHDFHRFCGG